MATWNSNGSPGGLLAGIGQNNANAPRASDANTLVSLIRDNNDRERAGQNNVGLQALAGLAGVKNGLDQADAAQQQKDFQKAYGAAYATGDRNAMRQLAAQYPAQIGAVQKGMGFIDDDQRNTVGSLAASARLAASNPETFGKWLQNNAADLDRAGVDPQDVAKMYQQDPKGFGEFADHLGLSAVGPEKYFDIQDKIVGRQLEGDRNKLTARGQDISAATTRRGQDISASTARRGQDISRQNSLRTAGGSKPASIREYEYFKNLPPDEKKEFLRETRKGGGGSLQKAQLAGGETVMIDPKPLGAGSTKFYKGYDADGNVITVPVSSLATSADSATTAGQRLVNTDLHNLLNASPNQLDTLTGYTGGTGSPAFGTDALTRIGSKETRKIYNSAQRLQGYMQNQGIGAAKAMGASGINTEAEAKRFFQSMPQLDYSSPDALSASSQTIADYVGTYNAKSNVNYGNQPQQQAPAQQSSGYSSLWGD